MKKLVFLILFSAFLIPLFSEEQQENSEINNETVSEAVSEQNADLVQETETDDIQKENREISAAVNQETVPENNPENLTDTSLIARSNYERPEVQKMIQSWLEPGRVKLLCSILENGMEYRLYVRKCVQERNVPPELEYLPVVESGYKPSAKSRSGALGMWQFMENSVKPFLVYNEYVDERLDPWKSTEAGLSKLEDNYRNFNDWILAIASYNCGAGAMKRAIKKAGTSDYWYLAENGYISSQTANYIPKLLAISEIASNPEKYGIELPDSKEEYENLINERNAFFDYVEVNDAYSIANLARELRLDEKTMKRLNPSLTHGFTPPKQKYQIRLPLGLKESGETAVANLEPIEFPFKYKVASGDSLWSISRQYGITVKALCDTNGIEENAILRIGKILYIPSK